MQQIQVLGQRFVLKEKHIQLIQTQAEKGIKLRIQDFQAYKPLSIVALTDFLTFALPLPIHQNGDLVGRWTHRSAWDRTQGEDCFQLQ